MSESPDPVPLLVADAEPFRGILLVANPTSGQRRAARAIGKVERVLREVAPVTVVKTTQSGDAFDTTRRLLSVPDANPEFVAVIGGDGTINEVARGLIAANRTDVPLGLVPFGTGNVLAKEFGIPRHRPVAAAKLMLKRRPKPLDVVQFTPAGGAPGIMLGVSGIGFDAAIVREFHASRKRWAPGFGYYVYLALKFLMRFDNPFLAVTVDGVPLDVPARWVIVSNTAAYGGPIRFAPHARCDDRTLDVIAFLEPPARRFFRTMVSLMVGDPSRLRWIRHLRATRDVRVEPIPRPDQPPDSWNPRMPVQVDGDPNGHAPVTFSFANVPPFHILSL